MEIERLPSEEYVPKADLNYIDTGELHDLYEKLQFESNIILVGPKGSGKSLSVASFCKKHGYPVITFDASEDVRRSHLIGMFVLRGNETPFVLGPLTTAIEVANEKGKCVLILEEINALTPQAQKVLNPLTDFRRSIEVPEAKKVFRLNPGAQLWVVGTMNDVGYGGVYQVNEDLKSRFRMLPVDYPTPSEEKKILMAHAKAKKLTVSVDQLTQILTLAKETRQATLEYALSTRDLVHIIEDMNRVGINKALLMITGKFDGQDRTLIQKRIESTFGLKAL